MAYPHPDIFAIKVSLRPTPTGSSADTGCVSSAHSGDSARKLVAVTSAGLTRAIRDLRVEISDDVLDRPRRFRPWWPAIALDHGDPRRRIHLRSQAAGWPSRGRRNRQQIDVGRQIGGITVALERPDRQRGAAERQL